MDRRYASSDPCAGRSPGRSRLTWIFLIPTFCVIVLVVAFRSVHEGGSGLASDFIHSGIDVLRYSKFVVENGDMAVDYFVSFPYVTGIGKVRDVRMVVFLFHGCTHSGEDWFRLPEEVQLLHAIGERFKDRNVAFIAPSSKDRTGSQCWDLHPSSAANADLKALQSTWGVLERELARETNNGFQIGSWMSARSDVPLFAIGASSGGQFATVFAQSDGASNWVDGTVVYIALPHSSIKSCHLPPTLLVTMYGDSALELHVPARMRDYLRCPYSAEFSLEAKYTHLTTFPRPCTAEFIELSLKYLPKLAGTANVIARTAVEVFASTSLVSEKTGMVLNSPRKVPWKHDFEVLLRQRTTVSVVKDAVDAVEELVQRCEGVHEMTSAEAQSVAEWMSYHGT